MDANGPSDGPGDADEEITTEIRTDVDFDHEGTVYAVKTVEQGDRRVDWKVGHIEGTFAEGVDYYYQGEMFDSSDFAKVPENAPSGKYKDDTFYELLDAEYDIEDGKMINKEVYDAEGVDTAEWAEAKLEETFAPETMLEEWWEDYWSHHNEET